MTDLVPNLVVNPHEKVALMRKGGTVRLSNYSRGTNVNDVTFGLAWVSDGPFQQQPNIHHITPRRAAPRHVTATSIFD